MGDGSVTSYFRDGQTSTTVDKYTQIFVQLINQIYKNDQTVKGVRETR